MEEIKCYDYDALSASYVTPGAVFIIPHSLLHLRISSISLRYIKVGRKCLSGTNTLAYWTLLLATQKAKCCEYSII
jgi:hypothetical protein